MTDNRLFRLPEHAPTLTPPATDRPRGMLPRALHALAASAWLLSTAHGGVLGACNSGAGRCRGGVQGRHPRRATTANTPVSAYPSHTHQAQ